jgi:ATP-dependent Clp protease adaptor protein ClpS
MADSDSQAQVIAPPESSGTAVAPAPAKKPAKPSRKPKQLPPYKVLLHNDDVNTFEHVILAILKLTALELEEAVTRTLEAHESGVALLLVTHKERAELYSEQFATFQITVTIEPDA